MRTLLIKPLNTGLVLTLILASSLLWAFSPTTLFAQDDSDLTSLFSGDSVDQPEPTEDTTPGVLGLPELPPSMTAVPPPPPRNQSGAIPPPSRVQTGADLTSGPSQAESTQPTQSGSSPFELTLPETAAPPTDPAALLDESDEGVPDDPFTDLPEQEQTTGPLDGELSISPAIPPEEMADTDQSEGTAPAEVDLATQSLPNVSGQVVAPPPPPWRRESRETTGAPSANGPLPDFDPSQGRWQQMEIGQFDRPRNAQPVRSEQDTTLDALEPQTQAAVPIGQTAQSTGTPSQPLAENPERASVRELFSDLMPPTPELAEPQTPTAAPAAVNAASGGSSISGNLNPPQTDGATQAVPAVSATGTVSGTVNPPPVPEGLTLQPPPPQPSQTAVALPPPPPSLEMTTPETPESAGDDLAISRAGSLLTEESLRPKVSSATVLEPGQPVAPVGKKPAAATAKTTAKPVAKAKDVDTSSGRVQPRPKTSAPAKPNLSVILVNETGRPQVAEDYRTVLSQIGYRVLSVSDRSPSGQGGQTVITYQSGYQSQARALARRLPGPRQLVASSEPLPAEAVIIIR